MALTEALTESLKDSKHGTQDQAAIKLAYKYAQQIDNDPDNITLGPKLLDCLEALLLTPRSRNKTVKDDEEQHVSPLDELRAKRLNRTKDIHTTAT